MDIKYYLRKAKDVHIHDVLSLFPMITALAMTPIFGKKFSKTWIVSERNDEARDNGYHFFKYMRTYQKQQSCIYAIKKNSEDYKKVSALGKTVEYGSVMHWIMYFSAKYLIGSQNSMPNGYIATFFERLGVFHPNHVFLQHGITKDMAEFLLASHKKTKYFIAGALPEFIFMRDNFGYPEGTMQYTGFARFDALHDQNKLERMILVMPTWRKWLWLKSEEHDDAKMDLDSSEYFNSWKCFLKDKRLEKIIEEQHVKVVFYPHPNMKKILDVEKLVSDNILISDTDKDDLQELLKSTSLLITDYSSVFFDIAYMKKPSIFYQFDEEKYRKYHYQQGWFDYHRTSFGKSCRKSEQVLDEIEKIIYNNFEVNDVFLEEHKRTFPLYDTNNSQRIYEILKTNS